MTPAPLAPIDLLMTADQITDLMLRAIRHQDWVDAYLLAAGLNQMVEDRLHPDPLQLQQGIDFLRTHGAPAVRFAGGLLERVAPALRPLGVGRWPRSLWRLRNVLTEATVALAHGVIDPGATAPRLPTEFETAASQAPGLLGADVLRLPTCFRSFDQHPDDVVELTHRFLATTDTSGPVGVVGVRTSGSYLAPLCAAALQAAGVTTVAVLTYRPGRPWRRAEAAIARSIVTAGGCFVVTDDPPVTGTALVDTGDALNGLGVPRSAITFLLALAGTAAPDALQQYSGVYLPWPQWSVHSRLTDAVVGQTLAGMLGPGQRVVAHHNHPAEVTSRARLRGHYTVDIHTGQGIVRRRLAVEGAGLGYLGRHAQAVAMALSDHLPAVYGLSNGLLYREWLPRTDTTHTSEPELAEAIAHYVDDRRHALRVDTDPTSRLRHREPVWETSAQHLRPLFGQLGPLGQTLLLESITRNLTRTDQASITDGRTHDRHWIGDPARNSLRKVDFHQWSFSNRELVCYDAIFDLAGAAADPPSQQFEHLLRRAYEKRTGQPIDDERWLLYRIAHLWRLGKSGELDPVDVADLSADAMYDYLSSVYGRRGAQGDLDHGALCAIDLDGVLETALLGYPCTTPLGAVTLRALTAHGYRPVLVTGRSLHDTIARCRRFDLAGAVAEYGAAVYNRRTGRHLDLRDDAARAVVHRVRQILSERDDVQIDHRHQYVVRARGKHGPIPADLAREFEASTGGAIRVVMGQGQTDLVPNGIDKGVGLRRLANLLHGKVAIAVGDSVEDLAMFAESGVARAPHNADGAVRAAGIRITHGSYQSGLAEACADLLGHPPGDCVICRQPQIPARTAVLCSVLGLREDGLRGLAARTARLTALAERTLY
jgi:hydroxymethylpyrimidine pyrophosphatase-like HAD family hydrolase